MLVITVVVVGGEGVTVYELSDGVGIRNQQNDNKRFAQKNSQNEILFLHYLGSEELKL